ncbi:MAG: hypothetical protein ACHQNT_08110 [Bacteroidia bacterium]
MHIKRLTYLLLFSFIFFSSCSKNEDAKLPTVTFKSGSGYISGNTSAGKNNILTVGIIADKKEAGLRRLDIKVKYSYLTNEDDKKTFYMSDSTASHFETDYDIKTAGENGTETWTFEVTDKDGNIGLNSLVITVQ